MIRIGGAFLAGVLVALASALIYVKATAVKVPEAKIAQPAVQSPPAKLIVADAPQSKPDTASEPPPAPAPVSQGTHKAEKKPVPVPVRHRVQTHPHKVEVAQNTAAALPAAADSVQEPSAAPTVTPTPQAQLGPGPQHDSGVPQPNLAPETAPAVATPEPPQAPVQQRQPMTVTLEAGTALTVRIDETLSTNTNYTGDTFRGTLESPIIRDGYIIADRGSKVLGTIVSAQKAGRMSGVPELTLALKEINTTDHQRVQVETNTISRSGPSSAGGNAAKMAGGAAIGAIIGAIAGGGKGAAIGAGVGGAAGTGAVMASHTKPAVIQAETQLTFRLAQPVTITEKLN